MSNPGQNLSEEPQEERGAPGSRDTGSDQPSAGPTDRQSGTYQGDEAVPSYGGSGGSGPQGGTGTMPPQDTPPAVPPYEGRKTSASGGTSAAGTGRGENER